MQVTIVLPIALDDEGGRGSVADWLRSVINTQIDNATVQAADTGVVITAAYAAGAGSLGALSAGSAVLELCSQALEHELGRGGTKRRRIRQHLAAIRDADITVRA